MVHALCVGQLTSFAVIPFAMAVSREHPIKPWVTESSERDDAFHHGSCTWGNVHQKRLDFDSGRWDTVLWNGNDISFDGLYE